MQPQQSSIEDNVQNGKTAEKACQTEKVAKSDKETLYENYIRAMFAKKEVLQIAMKHLTDETAQLIPHFIG